ncbi:MAG: hypothetical protein COA79_21300 [Planctomycetota bacterium]|nr:MAG: hypothetical protein COA79_21300 [Planctomycetota bacterium]
MPILKITIFIGLSFIGSLLLFISTEKKLSFKVSEKEAIQNLLKIYQASWKWKNSDIDSNSQNDFWTRDIAALYYYQKPNGKRVKLIPQVLALADIDPRRHFYRSTSFNFASFRGYGFKMILYDSVGLFYANADPSTQIRSTNLNSFGILAFPLQKKLKLKSFIINEKCQIFSKYLKKIEEANKWPSFPKKEGWKSIKITKVDNN